MFTAAVEFYLAVQPGRYGDDAAGAVVDGEHVRTRALGVLGQDLIAQLAVLRPRVVLILRRYSHYRRAWEKQKKTKKQLFISRQY